MRNFKNKQVQVLVGTDILSRGIDVTGIDLVINYDVPPDGEDYIHRIGRTARAETTGTAITFINTEDQQRFASIERLIGREIPKTIIPADLGEGPSYQPNERRSGGGRHAAGGGGRSGGNRQGGGGQQRHGGGNNQGGGQKKSGGHHGSNNKGGGGGNRNGGGQRQGGRPQGDGTQQGGGQNNPTPPSTPQ